MGIPRLHRPDKENQHQSRPWDNHHPSPPPKPKPKPTHVSVSDRLKLYEDVAMVPPIKKPLQAFFGMADPLPHVHDQPVSEASIPPPPPPLPPLNTRLGNRELKPLISAPRPPPLVGLPIPSTPPLPKLSSPVESHFPDIDDDDDALHANIARTDSEETFADDDDTFEEEKPLVTAQPSDVTTASNMSLEDPALMPRFSYRKSRHSVRLPPPDVGENPPANPRASYRNSRRVDAGASLSLLPDSSSFLDFNDDERLTPLDAPSDTGKDGLWSNMTFDDADSFDTFATTSPAAKSDRPRTKSAKSLLPDVPRPQSDESSEKPDFPQVSSPKKRRSRQDDEEDGSLDVPTDLARRPGAEGALRDLQRASIKAGKELANNFKLTCGDKIVQKPKPNRDSAVSKVQGELMLRSRIFRRWNVRYASIVHQGYFGAVLLLFRQESKGLAGAMSLKSSKMIALAESSVRIVENKRSNGLYMFELKTSQRSYMFACKSTEGRHFWMSHLTSSGE